MITSCSVILLGGAVWSRQCSVIRQAIDLVMCWDNKYYSARLFWAIRQLLQLLLQTKASLEVCYVLRKQMQTTKTVPPLPSTRRSSWIQLKSRGMCFKTSRTQNLKMITFEQMTIVDDNNPTNELQDRILVTPLHNVRTHSAYQDIL